MSSDSARENEASSAQWAVRIDRGLTSAEQEELALWVGKDVKREGSLLRAQAAWSALDDKYALTAVPDDAVDNEGLRSGRLSRRWLVRAGGGLLAAGLACWFLYPASDAYSTTIGEIRRLPLADGSLTAMNSATGIRVAYSSRRRDIDLERGEVWFRVAKDKRRPFIVASGTMRVQAVGTEFDVRRYPSFSDVFVTEGVVKIWSTINPGTPIETHAGYRARVDQRGYVSVAEVSAMEMERRLAWREGRIVLDDMTLIAAAAEFNRYSRFKLVIDPALANKRLVGWFELEDLEGFVKASTQLVGARAERDGKTIRIVPN